MKAYLRNHAIQIVGFVISLAISIGLLIAGLDTFPTIILGLILVVLSQLFDMQKQNSDAQERLLQANTLSQALYSDAWLLKRIDQIVSDYLAIKDAQFDLFEIRATEAVAECRKVLRGMAEGYLVVLSHSQYASGKYSTLKAKKSIKAVAAIDDGYWRSNAAEAWLQENVRAIKRGVNCTRVFVYPTETLKQIVGTLTKHQESGISVYIAPAETLPGELIEDYLIIDDRFVFRTEQIGQIQRIVVDEVEVELLVNRFDALLRTADTLNEALENLKKT